MTSFLKTSSIVASLAAIVILTSPPVLAQVTNGNVTGRITDQQGGAVPGVTVDAVQVESGFTRSVVTDSEGMYRLAALPVGKYKVTAQMFGFKASESLVTVNVATNSAMNMTLALEGVTDTIVVNGTKPLDSSHQQVVDVNWVESLPINGRQLADIAATAPGVGLGFHSDTSKTAQHTAQISGGNGRNVAVIVDGGDNNDETVGGMLQLFPLEAIQEFNLLSQRFDAEYGRAGAVMSVATKSGTNVLRGSAFGLFRDETLNAKTYTEQLRSLPKSSYERSQYGGSLGGPIVRDRAHFFAAYERTQQDSKQLVDTGGALPGDGVYAVPFREDLFTGKLTSSLNPKQYLAVRYARDHNSQLSGAAKTAAFTTWATSTNSYDSLNVNHNWMLGRSLLNEAVFQYSHFLNDTPANVSGPSVTLVSGARGGSSASAPQSTEQTKYQFRNDVSWSANGLGSHGFRTGVNIVLTPRLFVMSESGTSGFFSMMGNDINGGVAAIQLIGGNVSSNTPLDLYGTFFQDDWRVSSRLTVNLGVRYDYVAGLPIAQTNTNFLNMQAAGAAGRFAGTFLEDFGKTPRGDRNNVQPRLGAAYDLFGNGRDLIRGGWGIYSDLAYTNANVLTASLDSGIILSAACTTASSYCNPAAGFLKTDGTLFTVNDPIASIGLPTTPPTSGEVVSPRLQQPLTYQSNIGWSHELNPSTTITADYVRVDGRNLNMRMRPNVDTDPGAPVVRYLAGVGVTPNTRDFRVALSAGRSRYDAMILAARHHMSERLDVNASYTLAKATSDVGTAYDELTQNLLQNVNDPFSAFQNGPSTRTDARHRVTASTIVQAPWDVRVASTISFRSALPVTTIQGTDLNRDGTVNDHTPVAYRYTGLNADGTANYEEAGTCATVNCSRRAPFSQVNLRVSRSFALFGTSRIEAIAEVFNLFNAKNPFIPASTTMLRSDGTALTPATFMQPTAFAGDAGQGEQRVGQLGFRLTF